MYIYVYTYRNIHIHMYTQWSSSAFFVSLHAVCAVMNLLYVYACVCACTNACVEAFTSNSTGQPEDTWLRRPIGCFIIAGHFPQKSHMISG